jgi:hypothetical protein
MVYVVADLSVWTVMGEVAPVAVLVVSPAAVAVTVNEVAAREPAGRAKATEAAPSSKGRLVPTFVATTFIGAAGLKKSFCCDDLPPDSFFAIYSAP